MKFRDAALSLSRWRRLLSPLVGWSTYLHAGELTWSGAAAIPALSRSPPSLVSRKASGVRLLRRYLCLGDVRPSMPTSFPIYYNAPVFSYT